MNTQTTHQRLLQHRPRSGAIAALALKLCLGYLCRFGLSGGTAIGLGLLLTLPVQAAPMDGWKYDPNNNSLEFVISDGVTPRTFLMAQPARIVIDLPDTKMGTIPAEQTYDNGAIRQITVTQLQPQLTRVVLYMSPDAVFARGQLALERLGDGDRNLSDRWLVRPLLAQTSPAAPSKPALGKPALGKPALGKPVTGKPATGNSSPAPAPAALGTVPKDSPAPKSAVIPVSAPRFNRTTELATPPQAADYPPGMANVAASMQQPAKSPLISAPFPTVLPPAAAQKSVTAPPTVPQPVAAKSVTPKSVTPKSVVQPIAPPPVTVQPVPAKSETPKPVAAKPAAQPTPIAPQPKVAPEVNLVPATVPAASPQLTSPNSVPAPQVSVVIPVPPVSQVAPPIALPIDPAPQPTVLVPTVLAPTVLAPTVLAPTGVPNTVLPAAIPPAPLLAAVPPNSDTNLAAKPSDRSDELPPAIAPVTTAPTVSVPPLSTIPPVRPVAQPPNQPSGFGLPSLPQSPSRQPASPIQAIQTPQRPGQLPQGIPLPDATPTGGMTVASPGAIAVPSGMAPPQPQPGIQAIAQPVPAVVASSGNVTGNNPGNASGAIDAIEFGQPLPGRVQTVAMAPIQAPVNRAGNVMIVPAGTTLSLRYTGISGVKIKGGADQQEILELQTPIRDGAGRLLVPVGSTVLGRFESKTAASRFTTQSISVQGRSLAIAAQSGDLGGARQPSERNLLQNSGIGALAGAILGGLSGGNVLGGAAAGAAITYVTAPKATTIQPGQMVEIYLTEDFVIPLS
jgi:AMIN domain